MKLTTRVALKVAKLIKKLDIKINNPEGTAQEVGADVILQMVNKAGDAEDEILELLAAVTGKTKEEAMEIDLIEFFQEEMKEDGFLAFFSSALKSHMRE
jgi:VIT1/CCC1 family predicted Fe2+/Mn2+ transporter